MPLASSRIYRAKLLLKVPDDEITGYIDEAKKLIKILNFYYLSPVFLKSGGLGLKRKLEEKYGIKNRTTFCDVFMNLLTVPFCDEMIISASLIIGIVLMCVIWLPAWQQSDFNNGYNTIYGYDDNGGSDAFTYSCYSSHYQQCEMCNQEIDCVKIINNTCQYSIIQIGGCNDMPPVYCPLMNTTGWAAIKNATKLQQPLYVDPTSFIGDTYMTYMMFGKFQYGMWSGIICNRTIQGEYLAHWAQVYWVWSFVGILIGSIAFYIIYNCILGWLHNQINYIDPENYRLIRINA